MAKDTVFLVFGTRETALALQRCKSRASTKAIKDDISDFFFVQRFVTATPQAFCRVREKQLVTHSVPCMSSGSLAATSDQAHGSVHIPPGKSLVDRYHTVYEIDALPNGDIVLPPPSHIHTTTV